MPEMYIHEYTNLPPKEKRQLDFKRRYKADHPQWDDSMVKLTTLVRERVENHAHVLDAGCGNGNYVIQESPDKEWRTIGIDVDETTTRNNRWLDRIVHGHLEHLPFEDASFDLALSLWVLEHVSEPEAIFCEIFRVLKPGGHFAFVTPNKRSLLIGLRRLMPDRLAGTLVRRLYDREEQDAFPVRYRANTVHDLRTLAEKTGFTIETLSTNSDPSYTSFNHWTYWLSSFFATRTCSLFQPHIIGVLRKPITTARESHDP